MKTTLKSVAIALSLTALATTAPAGPFQNGSFELNGGNSSSTAVGWTQSNGHEIRYLNSEGTTINKLKGEMF